MAAAFRVLITDRAWPDCELERAILADVGAEVVEPPDQCEETLMAWAADVDAIGTCWARVGPDVIRAARRCKVVARFGIGLDNICVHTATERKIPVTYVPDYCVSEVSDHALALLLALARNVGRFHRQTKAGQYDLRAVPPMQRLAGQTLGLIGLGRIAQSLLPKAKSLGLNVIAHSRSGNDHGTGCPMLPFERVLEDSDFVSLHVPLTEETRHLLGEPEFGRMRKTAFLINTARGGLVNHGALWSTLKRNELGGAGLDVFDPEPPDLSHPLFRDERVIATPHAAFSSEQSLAALRTQTAVQISQALQGRQPEHVVNPHVYENRL